MSNKRNLFSITDTGEGIEIKCEAEGLEIARAFSALFRTSYAFRDLIIIAIEMAEKEEETGLLTTKHNEYIIPNEIKGNA